MVRPVRRCNLVGNQLVRRIGIWNAQQRFCDAHQQDTLFGRQVILLQECVDTAFLGRIPAHCLHQLCSGFQNFLALRIAGVGCRS